MRHEPRVPVDDDSRLLSVFFHSLLGVLVYCPGQTTTEANIVLARCELIDVIQYVMGASDAVPADFDATWWRDIPIVAPRATRALRQATSVVWCSLAALLHLDLRIVLLGTS